MTKNKFLQEINEQPEALRKTCRYYHKDEGKTTLQAIANLWQTGAYDKILFTGMGSSFFLSSAGAGMLAAHGIPAFALNAGELLHTQSAILNERTLLIAISQSGESYEVVQLLQHISTGYTVCCISNEADSTLANASTEVLLTLAGKEEMTSSKTFVTTYLVLTLLTETLTGSDTTDTIEAIETIAEQMNKLLLRKDNWLDEALDLLGDTPFVQMIGRGATFATINQCALMCMEAARTPASALLGGEFRHGPLEMVKDGFVAILLSHSGSEAYEQALTLLGDIRKFHGQVIFITDQPLSAESKHTGEIVLPCSRPDLFAISSILPIQLLINRWAIRKGLTPGIFIHGSKITLTE